jgi:hypothetical protein
VRIVELVIGRSGEGAAEALAVAPHPAGLSVVALDGLDPQRVADAIVETLTSRRPRRDPLIPFVRVTLESDRGRAVIADDAAAGLRMFDGDGGTLEADLASDDEAAVDAILIRTAAIFGVEADLIAPMLRTPAQRPPATEDPEERAYAIAVLDATHLGELVHNVDDRMTASVVPDWLWIATGFGGLGVLMTAIVLLYPEARTIVLPALLLVSIVGFVAYGRRSYREITLRAELAAERTELRRRRDEARATAARLREGLASRGRDPDEVAARLRGDAIHGLPLITARDAGELANLEGSSRPTIVFVRGPVDHERRVALSALTPPAAPAQE